MERKGVMDETIGREGRKEGRRDGRKEGGRDIESEREAMVP